MDNNHDITNNSRIYTTMDLIFDMVISLFICTIIITLINLYWIIVLFISGTI
jgi:hypothetical protein